jgi:1-acyl-sn-glycerol-3-phosphate acyltransferase
MLGARVQVIGAPGARALLIANHISWLDIPVLGSIGDIGFLSKAEVRRWPLIGWMSAQIGTLFIKRGGHQTTALIEQIRARVSSGRSVVIFPEGTTSDGHRLRRFHPRLMAAAQQPGISVQPLVIRYGSHARPDPVAPFIGDDNLLAHLWRVLCQPEIAVQVQFLEPIETGGLDRRRLATHCEEAIAGVLGVPVEASGRGRRRTEEPA